MMTSDLPDWARRGREKWRYVGADRPAFAEASGPDRESVWDYPRPPRIENEARTLSVEIDGMSLAETSRGLRVLETASPPSYYFPPDDVHTEWLIPNDDLSRCEWKGEARSFNLVVPKLRIRGVAWRYEDPFSEFAELRDYFAFYPDPLVCRVGSLQVIRQPGEFYGGWVTDDLAGPFKGAPGSRTW